MLSVAGDWTALEYPGSIDCAMTSVAHGSRMAVLGRHAKAETEMQQRLMRTFKSQSLYHVPSAICAHEKDIQEY